VNRLVSIWYERLERLSIFVDASRRSELSPSHDPHHLIVSRLFHRLESDPSAGLHTLKLHVLQLASNGSPVLGPDVLAQIAAIQVDQPDTYAQRDYQNYIVATSALRVVQRLANDVHRLIQQHRHRLH